MSETVTAYIALGSNLGERERNLREAVEALRKQHGVEVCRVSRFYETTPVGGPPQPDYLNGVVEIRTGLRAHDLLKKLQDIEKAFGRRRATRWGPRTLDLDLLLYGDTVIETPDLQVPHPRLHERRFVLEPLSEIAPNLRHPVLGKTAAQLLSEVGSTS
jgi:2-amino-4-hydroxy-6-hydroxymethyldihydropteridine diphosphokinase